MSLNPPLDRIDHDSALGRWTLWRRSPAPALAPFVTRLEGYVEQAGAAVVREQYPTGLMHMIIVLDHAFLLKEPQGFRSMGETFVAGLHRIPATVASTGEALCMQVDFTPLGARRFFRLEMGELLDRSLSLHEMEAPFARTLEGRLRELPDWDARFRWLEACLARRILRREPDDPRIARAWQALYASGGTAPVGPLAIALGTSRKHLVALFSRQVGATPKQYARIVRFSRALELIQRAAGAAGSLAAIAAECGYADQAHLSREFKRFTGLTPSVLQHRLTAEGGGMPAVLE